MSNIVFYVYLSNSKKKLFESHKYRECLFKYKELIEENREKIVFHRQHISNSKEVKLNRLYIIFAKKDENGIQQILKYNEYKVEEKFYVYGLKKRVECLQLIEHILTKFKANFTMVRTFKNKIVFECGDDLECILTKNESDCKRLYLFLKDFFKEKKLIWFLCLGKVPENSKKTKSELIQKLVDFTGLSHFQFKRRKSRH